MNSQFNKPDIAVLIPCLNEESTVATVISDCRRMLPNSRIYVYENSSTDNTKSVAIENGAIVRSVLKKGKGSVVTRMFAEISADVYVMIDGDSTYDVERLNEMVQLVTDQHYDVVSGRRVVSASGIHRFGHQLGNRLFTFLARRLFNSQTEDVLTGLRVMSRRFVKTFTDDVQGFELEVALVAHASTVNATTFEVPVKYSDRPTNSHSKLRTYKDGLLILLKVLRLYRQHRPARFFGSFSALMFAVALVNSFVGVNPISMTSLTNMMALAIAILLLVSGIILNAITKMRQNVTRLAYLSYGHQDSNG